MDSYVVTVLPGGRITIPAVIRKRLDLHPGDALVWFRQNGELRFRKAAPHEITPHERDGKETPEPTGNDQQSTEG